MDVNVAEILHRALKIAQSDRDALYQQLQAERNKTTTTTISPLSRIKDLGPHLSKLIGVITFLPITGLIIGDLVKVGASIAVAIKG